MRRRRNILIVTSPSYGEQLAAMALGNEQFVLPVGNSLARSARYSLVQPSALSLAPRPSAASASSLAQQTGAELAAKSRDKQETGCIYMFKNIQLSY